MLYRIAKIVSKSFLPIFVAIPQISNDNVVSCTKFQNLRTYVLDTYSYIHIPIFRSYLFPVYNNNCCKNTNINIVH